MNAADFHRNFNTSWFTASSAFVLKHIPADTLKKIDVSKLTEHTRIPMRTPMFTTDRNFWVLMILPGIDGVFRSYESNSIAFREDMDEGPDFDISTPRIGMVADDIDVAYAQIDPVRATARGLCESHIDSFVWHTEYTNARRYIHRVLTDGMIWGIFNPTYHDIVDARNMLDAGLIQGCLLSRFLAIVNRPTSKFSALAYKSRIIGHLIGNRAICLTSDCSPIAERYIRKMYPYYTITVE